MRSTLWMMFFLTFLLATGLPAQTISLEKFLGLVQNNHPFFQKEELSDDIETKSRAGLRGSEDWLFNVSPFLLHQKPVSSGAFTPERIHSTGFDMSAERIFWKTGARLSLNWAYSFADQNIAPIIIPQIGSIPTGASTFYQNGIFATYIHPLLQNHKGRLDKLDYELQEFVVKLTQIQAAENEEAFLLDVALRFMDWVLFGQQVEIAKERQRLAEKQLDQTRQRRVANLVDAVDVLRSEDAVRIAQQNILLLEAQWKAKQAELAVFAQSQEMYAQAPEFSLYEIKSMPAVESAVSSLHNRSRLLQLLSVQRDQLVRFREGFVETRKARLDLVLNAGLVKGSGKFDTAILPRREDLSVSLNYSVPLGNRTAKAEIEKTDLQINQVDADLRNIALQLEANVRSLLIQIKDIEKVLALNQEQIVSAQKKTEEELKLYNQGRGELTFVIQSQDNEQNARLTYAQNAELYHDLILNYRAVVDELLPSVSGELE